MINFPLKAGEYYLQLCEMCKKNTDFNNKWLAHDSQHLIMLVGNKIVVQFLNIF
jgi:hypothetical protein